MIIGINPVGWGRDPQIFGWGLWGLHEILLYPIMIMYMNVRFKRLSTALTFQKFKDLCILNKTSGDNTLNPVLCPSVCWIFWTHDPPIFKPTTPQFSNQIDAADHDGVLVCI